MKSIMTKFFNPNMYDGTVYRYVLIAWKGEQHLGRMFIVREYDTYDAEVEKFAFVLASKESGYSFEVLDKLTGKVLSSSHTIATGEVNYSPF